MNSYANLSQIKSAGWLNIAGTDYDTDLLRILEDAARAIDDHVSQSGGRRHFYTMEETRYFDGGGQTLFCDDILSISSLLADIDGSGSWGSVFATSDYLLYPLNGFPKIYLKTTNRSSYSSFASNVRQGIKITGVFGYGDGKSATPYEDSGDTVQNAVSISATGTSLTVVAGSNFAIGQTLRIGSEQVYVTNISGTTLTIQRSQNGTTGAIHLNGVAIYICRYPGPIVEATLLQASRDWKRRESPIQAVVGDATTGVIPVSKGMDPDVIKKCQYYLSKSF